MSPDSESEIQRSNAVICVLPNVKEGYISALALDNDTSISSDSTLFLTEWPSVRPSLDKVGLFLDGAAYGGRVRPASAASDKAVLGAKF